MDKTLFLVNKTDLAQLSKTDIPAGVADSQPPDLYPYLVIIIGHDIGAHFCLKPGKMAIGRSPRADIIIHDNTISRIHCVIELKNEVIIVDDNGSANGVYVNSQKIKRAELQPGVILQLGKTAMEIQYKDESKIRAEEQLSRRASTDALTGISNREHFINLAAMELAYAFRYQLTAGILFIDIDNFKRVNEAFGYQIGDFVLTQVAKRISETIGEEDLLGRYERDKFIIMPLSGTNKEKMNLLCERIRNTIENLEIGAAENQIKITVSFGFYISEVKSENFMATITEFTERAVKASYCAKSRNGKLPS